MNHKEKNQLYFASCPRGLEDILEKEISPFAKIVKKSFAGISFEAKALNAIEVTLRSRVASRIYVHVESYYIESEDDLYHKAREKWWHKVFSINETFKIQSHVDSRSKDIFKNELHLSRRLKDAIADSFRDHHQGQRPSIDTRFPDQLFSLRIEKSRQKKGFSAIIWQDIVGRPLSHRGYRAPGHMAPLRENLAAGMVLHSQSETPDSLNARDFLDPMCGSGTILIEAAMIQRNIAPSFINVREALKRKKPPFAFFKQEWFKKTTFMPQAFDLISQIQEEGYQGLKKATPHLHGIEVDSSSLEMCEYSFNDLEIPKNTYQLKQGRFEDSSFPASPFLLITNPPYGKRLEEVSQLEETYRKLGEKLKAQGSGSDAYILSGNTELSAHLGLKAIRKIPLFNGNIDCRLLHYQVY